MKQEDLEKSEAKKISSSKVRGIIVTILLLLLFQIYTFVHNKQSNRLEHSAKESVESSASTSMSIKKGQALTLFDFDPNTIREDSLVLLGFTKRQAEAIIKYRDKGGRFRKRSDFAKLYVVSDKKYTELEKYIVIKNNDTNKSKSKNNRDRINNNNKNNNKSDGSTTHTHLNSVSVNNISSYQKEEKNQILEGRKADKERSEIHKKESDNSPSLSKKNKEKNIYIDINRADSAELTLVKGIGPYYAKNIIRYRKRLGAFYNTKQVLEIDKMNEERFDKIASQIYVNKEDIMALNLYEKDINFLKRHPYIGKDRAESIKLYIRKMYKVERDGSDAEKNKMEKEDRQSRDKSYFERRTFLKELLNNNILDRESYTKLLPYFGEYPMGK